ncbi:MAG: TetR/AcrR family transcriptional regulator [Tenericutes bacterium]|jgi:AcrR family transcriptional regulator|nr:TetR/AcrR family transcriptional regulator [Mycoplasmatota bacterium]
MPSQTFKNLNKEKKNKIINAAIQEFSERNIGEASINKIVKNAEISRGSFYTYFNDKYDLVHFLIDSVKLNLFKTLEAKFIDSNRRFHQLLLIVHDELYSLLENPKYNALIKNISLFFHNHFIEGHNELPEGMQYDFKLIMDYVDREEFKENTDEFLFKTMMITQAILKEVLLITIVQKSSINDSRNRFTDLLRLVEQGYRRN